MLNKIVPISLFVFLFLGCLPAQSRHEMLVRDLDYGSRDAKLNAARGLVNSGSLAVEPLIRAIGDEDFGVRGAAAFSLGELGPDAVIAVPRLIDALHDEFAYVRELAARALEKIGTPEALRAVRSFYLEQRY